MDFFSVLHFSEVWDMEKRCFLCSGVLRALYFFRDSKDILKGLDFKYVKNPKYLSVKQHLKYHILEYCVMYHCWAERM